MHVSNEINNKKNAKMEYTQPGHSDYPEMANKGSSHIIMLRQYVTSFFGVSWANRGTRFWDTLGF